MKMNQEKMVVNRKDILIVDDMPGNLRVLSAMLIEKGYKVRKALDGQMAIIACQTHPPDLILLDIMMPELDGYQVCERLKQLDKVCDIPVIFLSALDNAVDKVKAFKVGGADYITKPFEIEEVLARIENQLTIKHLQNSLTAQNERLQLLNAELRRSNAELEQFAYAASHDLQSPLQTIIGYARIMGIKYKTVLDGDGESYLNNIFEAGMRMNQLIKDLLEYSRLGVQTQDFEPTDCKIILEKVLANLHDAISACGAEITYSELPIIIANPMQMMQLFQNLISNAIKFRRSVVTPQIKISAEVQKDHKCLIAVHDNGIGIESQYFERIFEVFQRLHTYQDYPGNGIGMAICKKIVERHGGKIWVESQVGVGTSFYFTLTAAR